MKKMIVKILELYARALLKLKKPQIVAVTGSVGKTSTKIAIAHVLQQKYKVLYQHGSYNSEFGLPLSLFNLKAPVRVKNPMQWMWVFGRMSLKLLSKFKYDIVVLEMGADQPGDIARFLKYIKPDVGVITAIQPVHLELLGSIENVYKEKSQLALAADHAIFNYDDDLLREKLAPELLRKSFSSYGFKDGAEWQWRDFKFNQEGIKAKLKSAAISEILQTKMIGNHSLYALGAAAAVGHHLGLDAQQIVNAIQSFKPVEGRLQGLKGKRGSLIIDDSYNASPESMILALKTLQQMPQPQKIAILGSMNELGDYEEAGHIKVGQHCSDLNLLVTIGQAAQKYLALQAIKSGLNASKIKSFEDPYSAGLAIAKILDKDCAVLVKGSQNRVFSEDAIKILLENQADESKLVRQSPGWQKIKQKQFVN